MAEIGGERVFRIGELAKLCGVPTSTLRWWARHGLIGTHKSEGGHRLFDDRDLAWVLHARDLNQGHNMTAARAESINSSLHSEAVFGHSPNPLMATPLQASITALGALHHDPTAAQTADLVARNALLFAEQQETATKLARLAEELATAKEAYNSALERIAECLWSAEITPSGHWAYRLCTPAIQAITGFAPELFLRDPNQWVTMVHFEDRVLIDFAHNQVLVGKSVDVEYRILRPTGEMRWVRNTFRPSVNTAGRVFRVDGVVADVTEHKLAEMLLRASEQKLRVAVASFPDTIITQDKNLRFTSAINLQGVQTEETMRGKNYLDIHTPEEGPPWQGMSEAVLRSGQPKRDVLKLTLKGKLTYRDTVMCPLRGPYGEIDGIITYTRDITEKVLQEQALQAALEATRESLARTEATVTTLRSSEALLRVAFDSTPEARLVVDEAGTILYANRACERLFGIEGPSLEGTQLSSLNADAASEEITIVLGECLRGERNQVELLVATATDENIKVPFTASVIEGRGNGNGRAMMLMAQG